MHGLRVCVFIMGYEKDRVLVHEYRGQSDRSREYRGKYRGGVEG